ncbi:hypothetical protein GOP47_0005866 [Adiantum capillus-veneris]|uniref:Pentatricopeptide repeat-containing protein n=1 Tax=Adiantum capillus-veneris TaxID=13818 RepID=A0A9D4V6J8_ADICA|nr:hypothetical protein GOP47_0005866 [Adiantum capillus-veneris]
MAFESFRRAAQVVAQRRKNRLYASPLCVGLGKQVDILPALYVAARSIADLNLDDLPPPSSLPRSRSFLSNKRSSLSRRMAAREAPDELSDFHGLAGSSFKETLERLDRLDKIGLKPHPATYAGLLQSAGNRRELDNGKLVHDHIMSFKYDEKDKALVGLILQMYRRCGSPEGARQWFDSREKKTMYLWTCMIGTYCQYGYRKEALEIYEMLKKEELNPEKEAFLGLVHVVSGAENLQDGRLVHEHIHRSPYKLDVDVGAELVRMYGRCENLTDSIKMFRLLPERNSALWNALSSAYAQNKHYKEAVHLFDGMQDQDEFPDHVSFSSALAACASDGALGKAMQIHSRLPRNALETTRRVMISLIQLYGKSGSLQEANRIFEEMKVKDVIAWNTLIKSHVEHGRTKNLLNLFERMKKEGVTPNRATYICILSSCANEADLAVVKDLHAQFMSSGLELDAGLAAAFVFVFGRCGGLQEAREVFEKVSDRSLSLWNAMIIANASNGCKEEALQLFDEIQKGEVGLDDANLSGTLSTYGRCNLELAKAVFDTILEKTVGVWNSMISNYVARGDSQQALKVFKEMQQQKVAPDKALFISILTACNDPSYLANGKDIHACISQSRLESDVDVVTALVIMYGKCGNVEEAQNLFDQTDGRTLSLWNSLIAVYAHNGKRQEALQAFRSILQADLIPQKETFWYALSACSSHDALEDGKQLHEMTSELGYEFETSVATALVTMYAKCGSLEGAQLVFEKAEMRNAISAAAFILGLVRNGEKEEGLSLFSKLQEEGIVSTKVTFDDLVSAFEQGVLAEDRFLELLSVNKRSGVMPQADHFNTLMGVLRNDAQLDEAEKFIYNLPYEPPNAVYSKLTEELSFDFGFKLPLY